ncbi:unnamed protein product, partial [Amoebophrya sp. A120]
DGGGTAPGDHAAGSSSAGGPETSAGIMPATGNYNQTGSSNSTGKTKAGAANSSGSASAAGEQNRRKTAAGSPGTTSGSTGSPSQLPRCTTSSIQRLLERHTQPEHLVSPTSFLQMWVFGVDFPKVDLHWYMSPEINSSSTKGPPAGMRMDDKQGKASGDLNALRNNGNLRGGGTTSGVPAAQQNQPGQQQHRSDPSTNPENNNNNKNKRELRIQIRQTPAYRTALPAGNELLYRKASVRLPLLETQIVRKPHDKVPWLHWAGVCCFDVCNCYGQVIAVVKFKFPEITNSKEAIKLRKELQHDDTSLYEQSCSYFFDDRNGMDKRQTPCFIIPKSIWTQSLLRIYNLPMESWKRAAQFSGSLRMEHLCVQQFQILKA